MRKRWGDDGMKEQTCCFTGHRNVPVDKQKEIVARTGAKVRELMLPKSASMQAINDQALRILRLFGNHTSTRVVPSVGPPSCCSGFEMWSTWASGSPWLTLLTDILPPGAKNRKRPIHDCCHCTTSASVLPPRPAEGRIWRGTDTWWTSHPCASLTAHGRRAARPIPSGMPQKRECLSSMLQRIFDKGYARRP